MSTAFVKGLQGDHPKYWRKCGARGVMAAYNAWNGTPMTVHAILKSLVIDQWGALWMWT